LHQKRGNIRAELEALSEEYSEGTEIQTVSLYKLMSSFERTMKKFNERNNKPQHVVVKYNYSLESQRVYLLAWMKEKVEVPFETLFAQFENRIQAIFTFLAMLELIQQKQFNILIGNGRNNFIIEWNPHKDDAYEEDNGTTPDALIEA
jgi:segregation and condensation protein A